MPASLREPASTCCVLVHGIRLLGNPRKWMTRSDLRVALGEALPSAKIASFEWSGGNTQAAREEATRRLGEQLRRLKQEFEHIVVISHSHGGNVALQAIRSLDEHRQFDLVTMGTPFLRIEDTVIETSVRFTVTYLCCAGYFLAVSVAALLFGVSFFLLFLMSFALAAVVLSSNVWPAALQRLNRHPLVRRVFFALVFVAILVPSALDVFSGTWPPPFRQWIRQLDGLFLGSFLFSLLGVSLAFAAVILSSDAWLPRIQEWAKAPLLQRRGRYRDACAPDTLRMFVAYHRPGDEAVSALRRVRTWTGLTSRRAREDFADAARTPSRFPAWPLVFMGLAGMALLVNRLVWAEPVFLSWSIGFCALSLVSYIFSLLPEIPTQATSLKSAGVMPIKQAVHAILAFGIHPFDLLAVKVRAAVIPGSSAAGKPNMTTVETALPRERGSAIRMLIRWAWRWLSGPGLHHSALYNDPSTIKAILVWISQSTTGRSQA